MILAEFYRRKVSELEVSLNDEGIKNEASELLRSLISRIVLTPRADAPNGLGAELHGDLAEILQLGCKQEERPPGEHKQKLPPASADGSLLSVVAGRKFEPLTFRL